MALSSANVRQYDMFFVDLNFPCIKIVVLKIRNTYSVVHESQYVNHRLLDSLVVEYWRRVSEVPGSIPSQGPRHTKDVIKMVPVVPLFSTQH